MDWFVKAFLKSSLGWLTAGVTLGVAMAIHRPWAIYRTAHFHMNLLGFVTLMIAGVAYHVIPRFTGHPLHNRTLPVIHLWLANVGLATMVAGFALAPHAVRVTAFVLGAGAACSAAGLYLFAYNLWRTIDGPKRTQASSDVIPLLRRMPSAPR